MNKNRIVQFGALLSILLTSCSSLGESFFIKNHEDKAVSIKYSYFKNDIDNLGVAHQPKNYVLVSDTLLKKKVLKQFPYKSDIYFDTLEVQKVDSLSYEVEIPAKSTIRIAPIYYTLNVEYVILNNSDTIRFVSEYPHIENDEFTVQDIIKYKPRLLADSYYILNIKLDEISWILGE